MAVQNWVKSNANYTWKLVHSAAEGARSGEGDFLHGEPLHSYVNQWARSALSSALIGAFLGAMGATSSNRRKPIKAIAYGVLGCAVGFGAGFTWKSRRLGASMATSAWKNIGNARDEHWLERNPITYA